MASANTKVYYCSACEDNMSYNRKQYFKHIKTEDHIQNKEYDRNFAKIQCKMAVVNKHHSRRTARIQDQHFYNSMNAIDAIDVLVPE